MKAIPVDSTNPVLEERSTTVEIGGKEYEMILSTAATMAISKRFGSLENLGEKIAREGAEGIENVVWLIALLCNQSIALHNFWHPDEKEPLLTEEFVALATTPDEIRTFTPAINEAIARGAGRAVESAGDEKGKNAEAG